MALNHKQVLKNADQIINPNKATVLSNIVKKWNTSDEKMQCDRDYEFIYQECMKKKYISKKQLTSWSQYARIKMVFSDRSRNGAYKFKVQDYLNRKPQWYPQNYYGFQELPKGWCPNTPPEDDPEAEPSVYIISIPGKI